MQELLTAVGEGLNIYVARGAADEGGVVVAWNGGGVFGEGGGSGGIRRRRKGCHGAGREETGAIAGDW